MTRALAVDIAERAALTFAEAFLATWLVDSWTDLTGGDLARRATVAGVAAVLAMAKGLLASRVGDGTASLAAGKDLR